MKIHEEFYDASMKLNPMAATFNLDHRFDAEYIHPCTTEYSNLSRIMIDNFRLKIKNFKKIGNENKYIPVLLYVLDLEERSLELPFHLTPVNHFNNPFKELLDLVEFDRIPFTEKGISDFKKRIVKFINILPLLKNNILEGFEKNITESQIVIKLLIKDLRNISLKNSIKDLKISNDVKNDYLDFMNKTFKKSAIDFASFLEEHIDQFSTKFGLFSIKDTVIREKMYQHMLDSETNITGIRPVDIYKLGLKLVNEYNLMKKELGSDVKKKYLDNKFKTEKEIKEAYNLKINEIYIKLGPLFPRPKSYKIGPLKIVHEKNQALATFISPDTNLKKLGSFNLNVVRPKDFFKGDVLYLSMHENVFGHGYQIPALMSIKEIPEWLRLSSWDSTDESWALYCEWLLLNLPDNIDFEISDIEKYALINSIQLRNIRLVADVGIHYYGFGQKKIKNLIKKYVDLSEEELISETNRYSAIPAQATSYATGLQYILKMRSIYLKESGNLPSFHEYFIKNSWKPIGSLVSDYVRTIS